MQINNFTFLKTLRELQVGDSFIALMKDGTYFIDEVIKIESSIATSKLITTNNVDLSQEVIEHDLESAPSDRYYSIDNDTAELIKLLTENLINQNEETLDA